MGRKKLLIEEKLTIIDQILAAVEYLHSLYICHRDIKLENVLLDEENVAHIGDFGFASICDLPVTGCFGSDGYAAPEVFNDAPYDGRKADMWSIGVLIFSILSERKPFSTGNDINTINFSNVPIALRQYIYNCLSKDPVKRCTVSEIRADPIFNCVENRHFNEIINVVDPINQLDYVASLMVKNIFGKFNPQYLSNYGANRYKAAYLLSRTEKTARTHSEIQFSLPSDIMSLCGYHSDFVIFKDPVDVIKESTEHCINSGCCISCTHNYDGITLNIVKNTAIKDEKLSVEFSGDKSGHCNVSITSEDDDPTFAHEFETFCSR